MRSRHDTVYNYPLLYKTKDQSYFVSVAKGKRFLPFALQHMKGDMLAVHAQYMAL